MFKAPPTVTSLPLMFRNAVSDATAFQQDALANTMSNGWLPARSPFHARSLPLALDLPPLAGAAAPAATGSSANTGVPPKVSPSTKKKDDTPHVDVSKIVDWAAKQLGAEKPQFPGLDGTYDDYMKYAEDALVAYGIKQLKGALNDLVEDSLMGLLSVPVPVAEAASVLGSGGAGLLGQAGSTIGDYLSHPGRLVDIAMEKAGELIGKLPSMAYDKLLDLGLSKLDDFWAVDDNSPLLSQLGKQFAAPFIKSTVKDLLSGVTSLDDLTNNFSDIVDKLDARIKQLLHGADPGTGQPAARIGDKDDKTDAIVTGFGAVIVQGQAVSRVLDTLAPSGKAIVEGAATVFSGGMFTARMTSATCIPSMIASGAPLVLVGGASASVPPPPEAPPAVGSAGSAPQSPSAPASAPKSPNTRVPSGANEGEPSPAPDSPVSANPASAGEELSGQMCEGPATDPKLEDWACSQENPNGLPELYATPEGPMHDAEIGRRQGEADISAGWWSWLPGGADPATMADAGLHEIPLLKETSRSLAEKFAHDEGYAPGDVNALQHTMWQALLAHRHGAHEAKLIGDQHEEWQKYGDEVRRRDSEADLRNNQIGRDIGSSARNEAEIRQKVLDAYKQGRLDVGGGETRAEVPAHHGGGLSPGPGKGAPPSCEAT